MKKHNILRLVSVFLALLMCFATTVSATSVLPADMNQPETEAQIEELLTERAQILNQIFLQNESVPNNTLIAELNAKDLSLSQLGVEFLSNAEVQALFEDKALCSTTPIEDIVSPCVTPIDSDINTWTSYTTSELSGGEIYNIQRLTAQPASSNSPLVNVGTRTVSFNKNWKAGAANVFSIIAKGIVSGVAQSAIVDTAFSLYDAVKSTIAQISPTTEVDVPHIAYTWSNVTTATFSYVRPYSQTDYYQRLSLVCTSTETAIGYSIPKFNYINSNGVQVLTPAIIQGSRTVSVKPPNYNSTTLAVSAYKNMSGDPLQNCVSSIQISGPESKSVQTISPCCPMFPLHCEY